MVTPPIDPATNLSAALQAWVHKRAQTGTPSTVADAMSAFAATEDVILEAVEDGYWLGVIGLGPDAVICVEGD